ncbi:MAG: hypothetical protein V1906_03965 [Candidatus Woesearchaeota archaeon]
MSLMPKCGYSNWERVSWHVVPSGLEGKIVTLDELRHLFPACDTYSEVEALEDSVRYAIYGRRKGFTGKYSIEERLACLCKSCDNLIIGPPRIVEANTIGPLSGRTGCDMYCHNCDMYLYEFTFERS